MARRGRVYRHAVRQHVARNPDLATKAAEGLFDQLRNDAHVIVAAPLVPTTITASVVSESAADGVLPVISWGTTRLRNLEGAADILRATVLH